MIYKDVIDHLNDHFHIGPIKHWSAKGIASDHIIENKTGSFIELERPEDLESSLLETFSELELKPSIIHWLATKDVFISLKDFEPAVVITEEEYNSGNTLPSKYLVRVSATTMATWESLIKTH